MAQNAQHKFPTLVANNEDVAPAGSRGQSGVGDLLRSSRLSRDEELQDVAQKLKIRLPYLQAIEDGDSGALPGSTYAIGFVRAYAEYLGLDAPATVDRFKAESAALEARTELVFPEPLPGNRVPGGALVFLALVLAGLSYGGWLYISNEDRSIAEIVPALPESLAKLIGDGQEAISEQTSEAVPAAVEASDQQESAPVAETTVAAEAPESTPSTTSVAASEPTPETSNDPEQTQVSQVETETVAGSAPVTEAVPETTSLAPAEDTRGATEPVVEQPIDEQQGAEEAIVEEPAIAPAETETVVAVVSEAAAVSEANAVAEQGETITEAAEPVESAADTVVENVDQASPAVDVITAETSSAIDTASESLAVQSDAANVTDEQAGAVVDVAEVSDTAATEALTNTQPSDEAGTAESTDISVAQPDEEQVETNVAGTTPAPDTIEATAPSVPTDAAIKLTATSDSWVEIRNAGGSVLFTGMLRPGESYDVPAQEGVTLTTGNAGGLSITVDGVEAPTLGDHGAVRRDIPLDPQTLL